MPSRASARAPTRAAILITVVGVAAGVAGAVRAQQLEEIIVTAERRELSLQETPISVMAFTGDELELRGVRDMFELATITPNLDIKGSRGTGNTSPTYEIRGISGGGGATGERSVGFYIDNVFMPRTTGPVMRVLDVEQGGGAARSSGHAVRSQQHRRGDSCVFETTGRRAGRVSEAHRRQLRALRHLRHDQRAVVRQAVLARTGRLSDRGGVSCVEARRCWAAPTTRSGACNSVGIRATTSA